MTIEINGATRFIEAASGDYPLTFQAIKQRFPNSSFPSEPSYELMVSIGYFAVLPSARPDGDVVFEVQPVLREDGFYEQAFGVRPFTPEEIAAYLATQQTSKLSEVSILRASALAVGAPIDFGGVYGVQHIQLRDTDRVNILGLRIKANAMIAGSSTDTIKVRTYENSSVPLTAQQVIDLSWKVLAAYESIMTKAWDFQDLIKAAETLAELPVLPPSFTPDPVALDVDPQFPAVAE